MAEYMTTPRRVSHVLIVMMICAASLRAEIAWDKSRVAIKAEPGQDYVVVEYPFTVTGDASLAIEKVDTGCSCASEILERTLFARGDKGTLKIRFTIGDREGLFTTPMLVKWKQGEVVQEDQLLLEVDIPVLAKLSRRVLVFKKGDRKAQSITIEPNRDLGLTVGLGETIGGYKTRLKSDEGRYTLTVTPEREATNGFVEVQARRGGAVVKTWRVFLRVPQ